MSNYAYIRVANKTENFNIESQKIYFSQIKIDKYFTDIGVSGLSLDREGLNELLKIVKSGDNIYVRDISRLARTVGELYQLLNFLHNKNISVFSFKDRFKKSLYDVSERFIKSGIYMKPSTVIK